MSQLDEIKNKIDLVELVGALGVNLRKTGRSFVGFCPFHPNTRTPAFTVYPDTQSFYCFGCHASGTAFDFVMRKQGLDFKQALEQLAARAGVQLAPRNEDDRQEDARRGKLLEINSAAARYFNYVLTSHPRGGAGRDYVEQRVLTAETVETFQLGYSLDEWTHLFAYLSEKKGYTPEEIEAAGLAIHHESRGYYDRFRGRLIFPIRNPKGEIVGFGGRALGDAQPKYLNTPETLLFKKGELLYGLDLARDAIRSDDRTVVVEGYMDVITAHQHGFRNLVAPLGTALTKAHAALLKRLSQNVYLALDADAAGQKATLRGLNAMRESDEEEGSGKLVATAQGAVRLESAVALRIIRMPAGRDPDEVVKSDPELWRRLVAEAAPVMEFYLSSYTAGLDFGRPEDQRVALDRMLPLLQELDGAQQRVYVARLEQVIGIRAELILDLLKGRRLDPGATRRSSGARRGLFGQSAPPSDAPHPAIGGELPAPRQAGANPTSSGESYLLALALHYPSVDAAVEALLEKGLLAHPTLRPLFGGGLEDLLEQTLNQELWRLYGALPLELRPTSDDELRAWAETLEQPLGERALTLLALTDQRPDDFRHRQEAEHCARNLRVEQIKRFRTRLDERARNLSDETEFDELSLLYNSIGTYLALMQEPRRSSTYPDLRNLTGRE